MKDEIARKINPESSYEIIPVRGEYYYFDSSLRKEIHFNGTNIYQVQKPYYIDGRKYQAIGIHLTPTFEIQKSISPFFCKKYSYNRYLCEDSGNEKFLGMCQRFRDDSTEPCNILMFYFK